jgi:hypothetical protein
MFSTPWVKPLTLSCLIVSVLEEGQNLEVSV